MLLRPIRRKSHVAIFIIYLVRYTDSVMYVFEHMAIP